MKKIKKKRLLLFLLLPIVLIILIISLFYQNRKKETASFNWKMAEGKTIKVYLNQHPYSEAIIKSIPVFELLTGIDVEYYISPETIFQIKHFHYLGNASLNIDVIMTGPYYTWKTANNKQIESLDHYIDNHEITHAGYDFSDFHPRVVDAMRWNLHTHSDYQNAAIWAIPIGFELAAITYNQKIFNQLGLLPPENFEEIKDVVTKLKTQKNITPLGVRGINNWTSIPNGFINLFFNYGLTDFKNENGQLIPQFNSKKSIQFHELWIDLLKSGVSRDWKQNTWYKISADLGAGKLAMVFDFDLIGYYQNISNISKEKGNLKIAPIPAFSHQNASANLWSWGLGINSKSNSKIAAWLFIQYFTSKKFLSMAVKNYNYLSPPRISILQDPLFSNKVSREFSQYLISELEKSKVVLTHQPYAIDVMTKWIEVLHKLYDNQFTSIEEGLNYFNKEVESIMKKKGEQAIK